MWLVHHDTVRFEHTPSWLCSTKKVGRPAPKSFQRESHIYVMKLSKAYKASNNVLKEIVKLSKEKYK